MAEPSQGCRALSSCGCSQWPRVLARWISPGLLCAHRSSRNLALKAKCLHGWGRETGQLQVVPKQAQWVGPRLPQELSAGSPSTSPGHAGEVQAPSPGMQAAGRAWGPVEVLFPSHRMLQVSLSEGPAPGTPSCQPNRG